MGIKENLKKIETEIFDIKEKSGQQDRIVQLLAVSKTKPVEFLIDAYECGQRLFGENRINEAEIKVPLLPSDAIFHMIGHLQSNKVKKACQLFDCIQSVDSLKIAKKINNSCLELDKIMDVYLEINIVNDVHKTGFIIDDQFYNVFNEIISLDNIKVLGLMCIGAHVSDKGIIKESFNSLKQLSEDLRVKFPNFKGEKLSMGMSSDYSEAIEAGSTMVRVGSSIFGIRK